MKKAISSDKPIDDNNFAILADHLPDFIARYDLEGRGLYLNKKLVSALGVPVEKLIGTRISELTSDGRFDEYEAKVLRTGPLACSWG